MAKAHAQGQKPVYYLTPEGARKLREELEYLKTEKRAELAARLRAAIQMGDLSENADYIATKEEQGFVEGRIQQLEHILRHAVFIENNGHKDVVELGARVTLQEEGYDDEETYTIVGATEADPLRGLISNESPMGRALLGKRVGDVVEVQAPNGTMRFKIVRIEYTSGDTA